MKYYIIAGEASGDLHGANLIKALKSMDNAADIRAWGGDLMAEAGAVLVKHYKEMAFMGFLEVIAHLPQIFRNLNLCKQDIHEFKPDAVIFIDYSGFNLRIARWAKSQKFKTHYYIAPQVWASREGRVNKLKKYIDFIYVILPFEQKFYKKHGMEVTFVGHPLLDAIDNRPPPDLESFVRDQELEAEKPIIALLPGSRKQEVSKILPLMLSTKKYFPGYQFVIGGAPSLDFSFYNKLITDPEITIVMNQTYKLLSHAHAALVTSGTATLETALFDVPQVVCYKGSLLSYWIAKKLIRLNYISLVNLIMDREVVRELIQSELTEQNLVESLKRIISGERRKSVLEDYSELKALLGGAGASASTAALIIQNT